ncbi:zonular occludens toxin domain-containing protein [uncultured Methylophaga sp.]|uniref:zonular occludens toxin domain-containing protein n=1 Tax=uncultured Methylophaga sp. TaxID=285271 RepID=UPI002609DF20|nr:zonular occludens toxin domain-containing protein [uncultured Methylophaga sp.]
MAVYFVTGKLGSGKSLVCVGKAFDYLKEGRRVATNLDLFASNIMKRNAKTPIIRLPDKPRPQDLEGMGLGCEELNEDKYGLLILDECGTWLNSRSWNDPERAAFIDFMLHARKKRWDVLLIVQNENIIDKQIRESLCEHLVLCRRLDRLQVPIISKLTKLLFDFKVTFPKIHRAKVHYGDSKQDIVADTWTYQAKNLYDAYDTEQAFTMDELRIDDETVIDMRATYTVLPRWHIEGRYYTKPPTFDWLDHPIKTLLLPIWLIHYLFKRRQVAPPRSVGASC